jgi:transposase
LLTPGQRNDITQAEALLTDFDSQYVIADKGYDSDEFIAFITERESVAVIPPRENRTAPREYDKELYKERHLVECCINKLKQYRRIFSRFEKLASRYLAFLKFAATLIWLR